MKFRLILILGLVLLALLGAVFYFFKIPASVTQDNSSVASPSASSANDTRFAREAPAGFGEYHNIRYHFSLFYPENLSVKEFSGSGSTITVTFQNPADAKGFQIYSFPYNKPQISQERFKKDIPSGVQTELKSITLAGATGAAFYSKDAELGDTYEVWLIKGGILYEVTTLKSLDTWLQNILQTWEFI